jgi:hypothetical protein
MIQTVEDAVAHRDARPLLVVKATVASRNLTTKAIQKWDVVPEMTRARQYVITAVIKVT